MTFGPIHCPADCCGSGIFDFYGYHPGPMDGSSQTVFYMTPSVWPFGVDTTNTGFQSSIEDWEIEYTTVQKTGIINYTLAPYENNTCWAIRRNVSHTDGNHDVANFETSDPKSQKFFQEGTSTKFNKTTIYVNDTTVNQMISGTGPSRVAPIILNCTGITGPTYQRWTTEGIHYTWWSGNLIESVMACNSTQIAFIEMFQNCNDPAFGYGSDVDDIIYILDSSGTHPTPLIGKSNRRDVREYPYDCAMLPGDCDVWENTSSKNNGPNFPRICVASPHDYPNVWSVLLPRFIFTPNYNCLSNDRTGSVSQSQTVHITLGPLVKNDETYLGECLYGDPSEDAPLIYGSDSASSFWSDSHTQTRAIDYDIETNDSSNDPIGQMIPAHVWAQIKWADSYGGNRGCIFIHGRATITVTGDGLPGGTPFSETATLQTWIKVKIGSNIVLDQEIWRDEDVDYAFGWAAGLSTVCPTESTQGVLAAFVWFERTWETGKAPTASTVGVPSGWIMHVTNSNGVDIWTLTSTEPFDTPDCYASSDRFIYVTGFTQPTITMSTVDPTSWVFSHKNNGGGPDIKFPMRQIIDGVDDHEITPRTAPGFLFRDTVKNSVSLAIAPSYEVH